MRYYLFLILFVLGSRCVRSFWPPGYKVDLNDRKVFVVASDETDYNDESENEMIRATDLAQFDSLADDEEKYKPLHSHVERYNKRAARTATEFADVFALFQPGIEDIHNLVEEAKPFVVGFKRELEEYDFEDLEERVFEAVRKKRNISDPSTKASNLMINWNKVRGKGEKKNKTIGGSTENLIPPTTRRSSLGAGYGKTREIRRVSDPTDEESEDGEGNEGITTGTYDARTEAASNDSEDQTSDEEENYDYRRFKAEYYEQIEYGKLDNKTFNYTDNGGAEETADDAIKKIVDFKMPRNCTREELTHFGAKALECLAYDYKHAKNEKSVKKVLSRTWVVVRVWICIYLCIALPCWCQKGWCCCCFNCAFCNPEERIRSAKKYYAENPPGVLTEYKENENSESKVNEFEPTLFELEAFENFESAIRNL